MLKYMSRKRLLLFTAILFGIFAIINLLWLYLVGIKFYQYEQPLEKVDEGGMIAYGKTESGYVYSLKPAGYLSYESGFLRVSKEAEKQIYIEMESNQPFYYEKSGGSNNEEPTKVYVDNYYTIDFYYWPRTFGNSQYGILFWDTENNGMGIYVDKDLQQLNGDEIAMGEEFQQILDEHREEILDLMAHAEEMWGLEYK